MKVFLFVSVLGAGLFSAGAQTATADDTTASGAKVGTGMESGINAPASVGPRLGPKDPTVGAIANPPPEIAPTPPAAPSTGTGAGAPTNPLPPGSGISTDGPGTGR